MDAGRPDDASGVIVAHTPRLTIRRLALTDAAFIIRQLNEPTWIQNIGDKSVHSIADAERYLRARVLASYARNGFGMYLVESKASGAPVGVCGLFKRDELSEPDIGFALLATECGKGYAIEAAMAVLRHAFDERGLPRLLAITLPANRRSAQLLEKLGMRLQGRIRMSDEDLLLYAMRRDEARLPCWPE